MADIRVVWSAELMAGDWLLRAPDLDGSNELVTATAISLFTHRSANEDDPLPHFASNRRGWWADHEAADIYPGATPIGSRLWLLSREKQTEETRARAEDYCREALQWMIDIGLAAAVEIACEWFAHERLGAVVTILRSPQPSIEVRFETLWDALVTDAAATGAETGTWEWVPPPSPLLLESGSYLLLENGDRLLL